MARPKISEAKKRTSITITVRPDTLALAKTTDNGSRFFEQASDAMLAIGGLMADLASGRAKRADVLEEIEDIVDAWYRLRDVSLPISALTEGTPGKKHRAAS